MSAITEILNIKLPFKIEKDVRDLILEKYKDISEKFGPKEINYILDKMDEKLSVLADSQTSWIADLSAYQRNIFELFKNYIREKENISYDTCKSFIACLVYFINPFDVIPDYTPSMGYVDDLFVLITCIRSCRKVDIETIRIYLNRADKDRLCR